MDILETLNVLMLYFAPDTRRGNGLGVFNAYEKSKADAEVHALVKYLINLHAHPFFPPLQRFCIHHQRRTFHCRVSVYFYVVTQSA